MSAQTGTPSFVPAAPGEGKKLRHWLRHVWSTPNPLWMREQRQSACFTHTKFSKMRTICASIPSTISMLAGSKPIWPDRYTVSPTLTACE